MLTQIDRGKRLWPMALVLGIGWLLWTRLANAQGPEWTWQSPPPQDQALCEAWTLCGSDVCAVDSEGPPLHSTQHCWFLDIRKEVTPTVSVPYRGTILYTVSFLCSGRENCTGITFTDTLPAQVDFDRWVKQPGGADVSDDQITWTGKMIVDVPITFSFIANHVGSYGDVVTNVAEWKKGIQGGRDGATFSVEAGFTIFLPVVIDDLAP